MRAACILLLVLACGCARQPEPKAEPTPKPKVATKPRSPFDENFWKHWTDGKVEVCRYEWGSGTATLFTHVDAKHILRMGLLKRSAESSEMVDVRLTLDGSEKVVPGSVLSVAVSKQKPAGPTWEQATFGPGRAFVTLHAAGQPDLQRIVEYRGTPFPAEVLALWARRIAWPRLQERSQYRVDLIEQLQSSRSAILSRTDSSATLKASSAQMTFEVHPALPHHIKGWSGSNGERAKLISCERLAPSSLHLGVDGFQVGRGETVPAQ